MPARFRFMLVFSLLALLLCLPALTLAFEIPIPVPCDDSVWQSPNPRSGPCDYAAFIKLLTNIFDFFVAIAVPVATIAILYAGFILIFSPTDSGKRGTAKKILWSALWGLVFVLGGYVIIKTVLNYFLNAGNYPKVTI